MSKSDTKALLEKKLQKEYPDMKERKLKVYIKRYKGEETRIRNRIAKKKDYVSRKKNNVTNNNASDKPKEVEKEKEKEAEKVKEEEKKKKENKYNNDK